MTHGLTAKRSVMVTWMSLRACNQWFGLFGSIGISWLVVAALAGSAQRRVETT